MANNYLNVHVLTSLAFANPNRDDAGAPKSAVYGGVDRARMSSQALKRAARIGFQDRTQAHSVRSANAANLVVERIEAAGGSPVDEAKWATVDRAVRSMVEDEPVPRSRTKSDDDAADDDTPEGDKKKDTLAWFADAELDALATFLAPIISEGKELTKKQMKDMRSAIADNVAKPSVEIAAFGRMFAASPSSATDAAVQVSHAISTHEHTLELDYFTAVDDLRQHGAGHIGLAMFTGAVYYRHFCWDRAQLQANLEDRFASSEEQIRALVEALLLELPRGKQTSTAHHSLPSLVVAIDGSRPANCAEAFEAPVRAKSEGFVEPSVDALGAYVAEMSAFAPSVFGRTLAGGRANAVERFASHRDAEGSTLPALVDSITAWLMEPAR